VIKVGQRVRFDPWHGIHILNGMVTGEEVIGTIISVYPQHRYFTVEYERDNIKYKTSFNFNDVYGSHKYVYFVEK
jgi:hypothetical protein